MKRLLGNGHTQHAPLEELVEEVFSLQSLPRLHSRSKNHREKLASRGSAVRNVRRVEAMRSCETVGSERGQEPSNNSSWGICTVGIRYQATTGEEIEYLACAVERSRVCKLVRAL